MNRKFLWIVALAIVVAGGWYYGFGPGKGTLLQKKAEPAAPAPTTSGEAVKIGAGTEFSKSIELAVTELNSRNGIGGRPVRIVFKDNVEELITKDGVKYIIGAPTPLAKRNKVIVISPSDTTTVGTAGDYVFRLAVSETAVRAAAAYWTRTRRGAATSTLSFEPYFNETTERAAPFFAAYRKKFNEPPTPFFQANAYSAVFLIKDLIEQNNLDTEKAIISLQVLSDWAGGAHASLTLDRVGNIVWKEFVVKKTENGVTSTVEIFTVK